MVEGKTVAVVGLGYVGLPLACLCAEKGYGVIGIDTDTARVEAVNEGKSPVADPVLAEKLSKLIGVIKATTDVKELAKAGVVLVCVPTPAKENKPDLSFIEQACKSIAEVLQKGQLIIIESTVYPGTVETVVKPLLEENKSGLKAGKDFFLGHCPERIDPGNEKFTIKNIPRVLACISKEGTEKAKAFYSSILDAEVVVLSSVEAAEAVKVVENTFRDINIAFVNELAKSFDAMGIDLLEVIKGASTKPFGYMPFYPGPGVGGHCIAQDPYYLISRAKKSGFKHRFLELARHINDAMPEYVVSLVDAQLEKLGVEKKEANVCVLGLAYKPEVDDTRKSPALAIAAKLKGNVMLCTYDPFVKFDNSSASLEDAVKGCDVVVLATHHKELVQVISPEFLKAHGVKSVVDARNVLDRQGIEKAGILYKGVGR